ncbi:hypothetical protein ElyMa_004624800 [Elysia marginata]|uniref:Reverse transcriptase domain-containing protein n=1 Tax=Elysia marginata TaxID=1093978 RepID=A0AAV4I0N0_9GAST|nr:hypothetical protein ElyMa_004624800 [Elysia marginata]
MVFNKIQINADNHLQPNQNDFRPGRTTTAHILTLERLIEGIRNHNQEALVLYFKKAFDSIHRSSMTKGVRNPSKAPRRDMKKCTKTLEQSLTVRQTSFFQIKAGMLQGDTLSPYLFAIVLSHDLRNTFVGKDNDLVSQPQLQRRRKVPAVIVADLDFAHREDETSPEGLKD